MEQEEYNAKFEELGQRLRNMDARYKWIRNGKVKRGLRRACALVGVTTFIVAFVALGADDSDLLQALACGLIGFGWSCLIVWALRGFLE